MKNTTTFLLGFNRKTMLLIVMMCTTYIIKAQTTVTLSPGQTWTVPAGVTNATFHLWGGGGGGAGSSTSPGCWTNGGGGGGGACVTATPTGLVANTVFTFSGGAGGIGSSANGVAGGNGGTTTFSGGGFSYTAGGGFGAAGVVTGNDNNNAGGNGGTTGTGTTTISKRDGGKGSRGENGTNFIICFGGTSGGGGGGGGTTADGGAPSNGSCNAGAGGSGTFPGGAGGDNPQCGNQGNAAGPAGANFGGGGAGCVNFSGPTQAGGNGGQGRVIIIYSAPCSGTPAPGNTAVTLNPVCTGESFTLSFPTIPSGSGITYQWQSSLNGSSYTNISGATNTTLTTTQSASTFYRCNVSCSGGGTGTSTALQVVQIGASGMPQSFATATFPPCGWVTNNTTYCQRSTSSAFGAGNGSAIFKFYDADGVNFNMTSPIFPAVPSGATFTFDFAYSAGDDGGDCDAHIDEFRVMASTDGGNNFTVVEQYFGGTSTDLNPFGLCTDVSYVPTAGQWSSKTVSLPAGTNQIRLRALSAYGNNLYIDNLNLNIGASCSGVPSPGNTVASTNNQCMGVPVKLSMQNANFAGLTYSWQTSPNNTTYTAIPGATNAVLYIQPGANGWYKCMVTCTSSGQTTGSTPLQVTVQPCIKMPDGLTVNTCSATLYDIGGSGANYHNNENSVTTICPSNPGSAIKATFSAFNTEANWDPLYIYNGPNTSSTLFSSANGTSDGGFPAGGYWGTALPGGSTGFTSTNATGCLTFEFMSDESTRKPGWTATITCIAPCSGTPTAGSTTVTSGSPFCSSESFTLTASGATVNVPGITYQWQSSPNNSTWTNIGGASLTTYTTTQNATTWYRCVVTCTNSNLSANSTALQVLSDNFMNCYCASAAGSFLGAGIAEEIYRVTLNGSSTPAPYANNCNQLAPGPGSILNRYSNFKTLPPLANLIMGVSSTFTVEENLCNPFLLTSFGTAIFVDYNHNGVFTDAGEKVFVENSTANSPRNVTGTFTAPPTALPGQTVMRILVADGTSGTNLVPCLNGYTAGETEDWLVNIIAPNATSNSPVCENDTIKLFAPTTGVSYSWTTTAANGFTSTVQNPIILTSDASDAGLYTVVVNTGSGSYSASVTVVVRAKPSITAAPITPFCEGTQNLNLNATAPTGISYLWSGPGGYSSTSEDPVRTLTTPAMSGTYTVRVTDVFGCKNTAATSATIYALPIVAIIPLGSTNFCTGGEPLFLLADSAGPGATYIWNTLLTGEFISVTAGGLYQVTGTDLHGCMNTDNIVITESAPPAAPVIAALGDTNICSSDDGATWTTVALHVVNYASGSLAWNSGDFGPDITALYPLPYAVTYTDALFCSSTSLPINVTENYTSTAPLNTQISSDAPGNITCAVPVTLTLAEADGSNRLADAYLGTTAHWAWYDDAGCGVNLVDTGASITVTPSAIPGPHNYYVRAEGRCNNTACAFITINVKEPSLDPVSASASSPSICEGDQTVLSVTGGYLGTGASWMLYEDICGGAAIQTSSTPSFTVTPQSPGLHTYFIRAEGDCNNTICSMIQVDVKDSSSRAVTLQSSASILCEGDPLTLNVNGGHLGRGAVWSFYQNGCGSGAPLQSSTSSSLTITPQPGLHFYFVRAEGDCNNTLCRAVSVFVKDSSEAATASQASPAVICEGDQTVLSVSGGHLGTGASWMLFENNCGGAAIQSSGSPNFTITPQTPGLHTYFIRAEGDCNNTDCRMIQVDVKDSSSQAVALLTSASDICEGATVSLNISGGHLGRGAVWSIYEGGCGTGVLLQSGASTSLTITPQSPGLHTYYARAEGDCNNTLCMTVSVDVKDSSEMATASQASPAVICEGDQTVVSVSGGHLGTGASWMLYENNCGGAALQTSSSPSFTITPQTPGLHTYFIRAEGDCNNTDCRMIQVDVKDSSSQAVALLTSASDICEGSSVTLNISGGHLGRGAVWSWYEGGCGNGAALQSSTSTSLTFTPQTPGLHTYYVRAAGDCNTTLCRSVSVNVKDSSHVATSASTSFSVICFGQQVTLSVNGGYLGTGASWRWYSGSCGGTLVGIGASVNVNPTATTTYYVRAVGDCNTTLCRSTTVTVRTPSTDPTSATSNAPVNGICIGGSVTMNVSGGSLGNNSIWVWYEDACGTGNPVGFGSSITIVPAFQGLHNYYVRAEGPCNVTNCASVSVLVGTYSVEATSASSAVLGNSICLGNNIALSVDGGFLGTVAQWKWYTGSCGGTLVGTGASVTVNPSVTTTYYVRAEGSCNTTSCVSMTIFVSTSAPAQHANIIQSPQSICSGNQGTFTCQTVSNATYYSWSAPNGTTFNGNNPSPYVTTVPNVNVTFGPLPNGVSGYDICVFAGNGCGTSATKCKHVNGRAIAPQSISGPANSCPNTSATYTCASSPGADTYLWTMTGNASFTNGNDSIVTNGTSTTVNFGSGWTSGLLSVFAQMNCGYQSPAKTINIVSTPLVPGIMTGPTLVCPNSSYTYSIAAVAGAVSYNWSTNVPGAIIGAGTTSRSITFPSVIPTGSTISVTATGSCGTSLPRVKNIATGMANAPGTITGASTGQCGQTGVGYSILPVQGATSYLWTVTNGTIPGLNNITSVSINFPGSFTNSTVSVVAINSCGNSAAQTKLVKGAPGAPGPITGVAAVCIGSVQTYSVVGSTGATQYDWTCPAGSQILSGQYSASIQVLYMDNTGGNVSVYASNTCGNSDTSHFAVSVICRLAQISQGSLIDAMLYPNPTVGTTTLKFETSTAGDYKVSVVDMTGQLMQSQNVIAVEGVNMHELDLSTYAKGLYMVRLERDGEAMQMLRVTVE